MHGLALQQVQALRAVCLIFSPLLLMTAVLAMGALGGWIFHVASTSIASTDASSSLPMPSSIATSYPCAVLSYAFGLASPACYDVANSEEQEQQQLDLAHSTNSRLLYLHSAAATSAAFAQHTVDQHQHQHALLSPGLLSLFVGFVGPCLLFLFLQYQIWRGELRLEDEFLGLLGAGNRSGHGSSSGEIHVKNEKRRKEILEMRLGGYTNIVHASDVVRPPCSQSRTNESWEYATGNGDTRTICVGDIDAPEQHDFRSCGECCQSVVLVPKPGQTGSGGGSSYNGPKREVPNLCCICFSDYQSGQEIVWSSNRSCRHAFHKSCVMPWLIKTLCCPVCRQSFVSGSIHH